MKKRFLIGLILAVCLALSSCDYTSENTVTDLVIPQHVNHIEFWNGGTCIGSYENAKVEIVSKTRNKAWKVHKEDGQSNWIIYSIYSEGKSENILDSESLCIKYY